MRGLVKHFHLLDKISNWLFQFLSPSTIFEGNKQYFYLERLKRVIFYAKLITGKRPNKKILSHLIWRENDFIYIFDSDLFLFTRNLFNERIEQVLSTKSPFILVSSAVNFQRELCRQKACFEMFVLKLSGIQKYL